MRLLGVGLEWPGLVVNVGNADFVRLAESEAGQRRARPGGYRSLQLHLFPLFEKTPDSFYSARACGLGRRPTVTVASTSWPWRFNRTFADWPGARAAIRLSIPAGSETGLPCTSTSTSPGLTPALSAGPPRSTPAMSAPRVLEGLNDSAI